MTVSIFFLLALYLLSLLSPVFPSLLLFYLFIYFLCFSFLLHPSFLSLLCLFCISLHSASLLISFSVLYVLFICQLFPASSFPILLSSSYFRSTFSPHLSPPFTVSAFSPLFDFLSYSFSFIISPIFPFYSSPRLSPPAVHLESGSVK